MFDKVQSTRGGVKSVITYPITGEIDRLNGLKGNTGRVQPFLFGNN